MLGSYSRVFTVLQIFREITYFCQRGLLFPRLLEWGCNVVFLVEKTHSFDNRTSYWVMQRSYVQIPSRLYQIFHASLKIVQWSPEQFVTPETLSRMNAGF